jgi:hypothetical protein
LETNTLLNTTFLCQVDLKIHNLDKFGFPNISYVCANQQVQYRYVDAKLNVLVCILQSFSTGKYLKKIGRHFHGLILENKV